MSDAGIRAQERAAATGDLQAETRVLRERMRRDELEKRRVQLAAFLGHQPSREIVGWYEQTDKGGELCCCGDVHAEFTDHSPVHACDYYGTYCDCRLEPITVQKRKIYPDKAALKLWLDAFRLQLNVYALNGVPQTERIVIPTPRTYSEIRMILVRSLLAVARLPFAFWRCEDCAALMGPCGRHQAAHRALYTAQTWVDTNLPEHDSEDAWNAGYDAGRDLPVAAWAAARLAGSYDGRSWGFFAFGLNNAAALMGNDGRTHVLAALRGALIPWLLSSV